MNRVRGVVGPVGALILMLVAIFAPSIAAQTVGAISDPLARPTGAVYDTHGNLYVSETNRHWVRRLDAYGGVSTIAGTGVQGFAGDGGSAGVAQLDAPGALAIDAAGDLYIVDAHNQRVRRVDAVSGVISTIAGNGVRGFAGDGGAAKAAQLDRPTGLAVDAAGNVFIADSGNHRVRRVRASDGTISTIAGDGVQGFAGDGGLATAASLHEPSGLAVDAGGNLYLADAENHRVRVVSASTGLISTVAGTGVPGVAGLAHPEGLAVDASGVVYVADSDSQRVLRLGQESAATTAGNGVEAFAGDGHPAVLASFDTLRGLTLSGAGLVTIADTRNGRMRQIAADGTISTILGAGATVSPDFTLAVAGANQQTVTAGAMAAFPFAVQTQGGVLGSPIALTAGTLPAGMSVSFSPATLPASGGPGSFTLTVQTAKSVAALGWGAVAMGSLALLLPLVPVRRAVLCSLALLAASGCGFQATKLSDAVVAAKSFPITVSAAAKAPSGAMLVHTATVTVSVQ